MQLYWNVGRVHCADACRSYRTRRITGVSRLLAELFLTLTVFWSASQICVNFRIYFLTQSSPHTGCCDMNSSRNISVCVWDSSIQGKYGIYIMVKCVYDKLSHSSFNWWDDAICWIPITVVFTYSRHSLLTYLFSHTEPTYTLIQSGTMIVIKHIWGSHLYCR